MDIFSLRLRELRVERGLTKTQLAAAIGTTYDCIYSWENGRSQPSIEMIRALCKVFEVSSEYLLGISDNL